MLALVIVCCLLGGAVLPTHEYSAQQSSLADAEASHLRVLLRLAVDHFGQMRATSDPLLLEDFRNTDWYRTLFCECCFSGQNILTAASVDHALMSMANGPGDDRHEAGAVFLVTLVASANHRDRTLRDSVVVTDGPVTIQRLSPPAGYPMPVHPSQIEDDAVRLEYERRYAAVYERMHAWNRRASATRRADQSLRLGREILARCAAVLPAERIRQVLTDWLEEHGADESLAEELMSDLPDEGAE